MLYRLHFRDEWDPNEPRGLVMYFHGNHTGTQRDMTTSSFAAPEAVLDLG